jgi:hypothetical protein
VGFSSAVLRLAVFWREARVTRVVGGSQVGQAGIYMDLSRFLFQSSSEWILSHVNNYLNIRGSSAQMCPNHVFRGIQDTC